MENRDTHLQTHEMTTKKNANIKNKHETYRNCDGELFCVLFLFPSHYSILMCLYKCTSFATRYVHFFLHSLYLNGMSSENTSQLCVFCWFFSNAGREKNCSKEMMTGMKHTERNGNGNAKINAFKTGTTITCIEQLIVLNGCELRSCDSMGGY